VKTTVAGSDGRFPAYNRYGKGHIANTPVLVPTPIGCFAASIAQFYKSPRLTDIVKVLKDGLRHNADGSMDTGIDAHVALSWAASRGISYIAGASLKDLKVKAEIHVRGGGNPKGTLWVD
jgi:hypothetical protein